MLCVCFVAERINIFARMANMRFMFLACKSAHSSIPPFIHSLSVTPLSQACRGQKSRSNSLEVTKDDFETQKKE